MENGQCGDLSSKYHVPCGMVALGLVVLWLLLVGVTYFAWIKGANHRDLYPLWAGSRLAIIEGRDLYAVETTRQMQLMLYGRELPRDVDQQAFAYPAILVPLLLPIWLINDVEIATAVWEATTLLLLLGSLLLVRKIQNVTPIWFVVALGAWYYPFLMLFQGQVTAVPIFAVSMSLWAYTRQRYTLAGAVLALGFIKPELMLFPALTLLGFAVYQRHWRVTGAFAAAALALFIVSIVINGWWILRWVSALSRYSDYAKVNWAPGITAAANPVAFALLVLMVGVVLVSLRRNIATMVSASVPLGMLLLPQTLIWGLTMLTLPLAMAWGRWARWGAVGVWLAGWLLAFGSGQSDWWRLQSILLPVLTLGVVVWASRDEPAVA